MIRRLVAAALLLIAVVAPLAACAHHGDERGPQATSDAARPLTTEEAQRLALARFRNFDAGVRRVAFEVNDGGLTFVVDAKVDFATGLGYGIVTDEAGTEQLLLGWSGTTVSTIPWTGTEEPLPAPPADEAWTTSQLVPTQSRLHAVLALLLEFSSDRPDNALLMQQTDARWLRDDVVTIAAGTQVNVIVVAGPTADVVYDPDSGKPDDGSAATVRYWVDESGIAHRIELRLGEGGDWTVVDLGEGSDDDLASEVGDLTATLGLS